MNHKKTINYFFNTNIFLYIIIFFLPFIFFHWLVPFISDKIFAFDYSIYSISHQLELMFSLKNGSYPLYIPGFAGGQSSSALTLGQFFHPISHIASILPGYWNGYATEFMTLLRLLSLCITQLFLFNFLKILRIRSAIAFILSTLTLYSSQIVWNFYFAASLEAYTGYLLLCIIIGHYFIRPSRIKGILISLTTYLLICSGHPQMMYYGILGAGLFTFLIPYFIGLMLPEMAVNKKIISTFWLHVFLWTIMGILLAAVYIIPYYFDFLSTNAGRVNNSYAWADMYRDTFWGTISNFFSPLRSQMAFGGSSIFIMAGIIPVLKLFRIRIPKIILFTWFILLVIFLHIQGGRTPVHHLFWEYLPFASSFRNAGRIAIITPILFLLIFCWIFEAKKVSIHILKYDVILSPQNILAFISLILLTIYMLLPQTILSDISIYAPISTQNINKWVEPFLFILSTITLIILLIDKKSPNHHNIPEIILCVVICIQLTIFYSNCSATEFKQKSSTFDQMLTQKKKKLAYPPDKSPGAGLAARSIVQQADKSFLEPCLAKFYPNFVFTDNIDKAYKMMAVNRPPDQAFIEHISSKDYEETDRKSVNNYSSKISLVYSSFNRINFKVDSSADGYFVLSYPFSDHWSAEVDGNKAETYRANGIYIGVKLPAGISHVEFRYWSDAVFWGVIISLSVFFLICALAIIHYFKKPLTIVSGILIASLLSLTLFLLWYHSLYTGINLKTNYQWTNKQNPSKLNIAYGKHTEASSVAGSTCPYFFKSSRAVDGYINSKSPFATLVQKNPWWMVDLHTSKRISSIIIHKISDPGVLPTIFTGVKYVKRDKINNKYTVRLLISNDKKIWLPHLIDIKSILTKIVMKDKVKARYVMIQAIGNCRLALEEIEIY